jgi:pseudaminic acid biosynthesis-associated methylase
MYPDKPTETHRLESLWSGSFGEQYVERNRAAGSGRGPFWEGFLDRHPVERVLEVGCNLGGNLEWISNRMAPRNVYGLDINERALQELRQRLPTTNALWAPARDVPFRDGWFDLVFTAGVLIHQPQDSLLGVMAEIVRCSRRYVLCMEYFAPETVEVPYRGQSGLLFKRDYGRLYREEFLCLRPVESGTLSRAEGWDDITWWLFEKQL